MAYRGGRGPGRGGFGAEYAKDTTLPDRKSISEGKQLNYNFDRFEKFWKTSIYPLRRWSFKEKSESLDIERFSDTLKPKKKKLHERGSFFDYLVLRPDNFPKELLGGSQCYSCMFSFIFLSYCFDHIVQSLSDTPRVRPVKRAKWTQDADLHKLEVLEKLEAKLKAEGKEEENEEGEGDDEADESEGEDSENGDYDKNKDFDDDDNDYNVPEDNDNEEEY
ncbi:hypothetical protein Bca52824_028559 [Brassica carinata]|uniref:DNA-directed RNA polymerase III subunit n=1 Tax=Brassica carinata TaxID=52824 RepID=A0A8X7VCP4_BRACI|nr:hypothetical protein Bca52824_028559 [Brassica carinata]